MGNVLTKQFSSKLSERGHVRGEKIRVVLFQRKQEASIAVANEIAELISMKSKRSEFTVLGLATGSSPILVYKELVRLHQQKGLSFKNVFTFNLDEYYPIKRSDSNSYWSFMHKHLFSFIDVPKTHINIPSGEIEKNNILQYCLHYEEKIKDLGGIDYQLLGIGRTGHIGFNEPGSSKNSLTRLIRLDHMTRSDASSDFGGIEQTPRHAITMGIQTILNAKKITLLAWGGKKSEIVYKTIEEDSTSNVPASFLQSHTNCIVVVDKDAASHLSREKSSWILSDCKWDDRLIRKAVVWLSQRVEKPILKLTERDYNENGLSDLLAMSNSAYELNIRMFNALQHTITGWPGGKPNTDDSHRPERSLPTKKRVLVFSPHPDDDVISMGGTLSRLIEQGHDVFVAYQTSGNIAVYDHEVAKFAEWAYSYLSETKNLKEAKIFQNLIRDVGTKKEKNVDLHDVRRAKRLIRKCEALSALRYFKLNKKNAFFMNLPFYETGTIEKNPINDRDIKIVENVIKKVKPHQIFAAGDLLDPHGTHEACLNVIFKALNKLRRNAFMNDCWLWLYRGAWQEWDIHDIDMAVPLSPDELLKKRKAIFFHQSQKDNVPFIGDDVREFWVRAEQRNKATAQAYGQLGLAAYEAIEAFKRYYY